MRRNSVTQVFLRFLLPAFLLLGGNLLAADKDCIDYILGESVEDLNAFNISVATSYGSPMGSYRSASVVAVNGRLYEWNEQVAIQEEEPRPKVAVLRSEVFSAAENTEVALHGISLVRQDSRGSYIGGMGLDKKTGKNVPWFVFASPKHEDPSQRVSPSDDDNLLAPLRAVREAHQIPTPGIGEEITSVQFAPMSVSQSQYRFEVVVYLRTASGEVFRNTLAFSDPAFIVLLEDEWEIAAEEISYFQVVGKDEILGVVADYLRVYEEDRIIEGPRIPRGHQVMAVSGFALPTTGDTIYKGWVATERVKNGKAVSSHLWVWDSRFPGVFAREHWKPKIGEWIVDISATVNMADTDRSFGDFLSRRDGLGGRMVSERVVIATVEELSHGEVYRLRGVEGEILPWNLVKAAQPSTPWKVQQRRTEEEIAELEKKYLIKPAGSLLPTQPVRWDAAFLAKLRTHLVGRLPAQTNRPAGGGDFRSLQGDFPHQIYESLGGSADTLIQNYKLRVEINNELGNPNGAYRLLSEYLNDSGLSREEQILFVQLFGVPGAIGTLPRVDMTLHREDIARLSLVFMMSFEDVQKYVIATTTENGGPAYYEGHSPEQPNTGFYENARQNPEPYHQVRGAVESVYLGVANHYAIPTRDFGTPSSYNPFHNFMLCLYDLHHSGILLHTPEVPSRFGLAVVKGISFYDPLSGAITVEDGLRFLE